MTLATSADKPSPERILRIGVIQNGRIIEERLVRRRKEVTIGQSSTNTLAIPSDELPRSWPLFRVRAGRYEAHLADGMDARLAVGNQIVSLAQLKQAGRIHRHGAAWRLPLDERSRGKVTAGDVTVLFQLSKPPPERPRPRLPVSLRRSLLDGLEPVFTIAAAASFVLHLALVLHLRNVDWPRRPDPEILPERWVEYMPRKLPTPPIAVAPPISAPIKLSPKTQSVKPIVSASRVGPAPPGPRTEAQMHADRMALKAQVDSTAVIRLLTGKGRGGAFADLLGKGSPDVDQAMAMQGIGGIKVAGTDEGLRGLIRPGSGEGKVVGPHNLRGSGGIAIGDTGGSLGERRVPTVVRADQPVINEGIADPGMIAKEVKTRLGGIRGCYERALKRNPSLSGKISLRWTITPAGTVSGIEVEEDTMGDPEVVNCIKALLARWRFPPPEGGSVEVTFPFVFQSAG